MQNNPKKEKNPRQFASVPWSAVSTTSWKNENYGLPAFPQTRN